MRNAVQLITYVDRLGRDIDGVASLLSKEMAGLFGGVHLLPFFDSIDGADAGFDPKDHTCVDHRLGDWAAIKRLSEHTPVMADLIVNHVSSDSRQFRDVMQNGCDSEYWSMFLRRKDVFPDEKSIDLNDIYRPRPGEPFSAITLANGDTFSFWTTFSSRQLDIDVESDLGAAYLDGILQTFSGAGIQMIRLDAAGYAIKRKGTSCFMLPETFEFIGQLTEKARALGMEVLVEIHSHFKTQIDIASRVSRVYDFALPPLVLHTLYGRNADALKSWLNVAPRNCMTVLDTHDGIGIIDAARDGEKPGLLNDEQINVLVEEVHRRTDGQSLKASGDAASNLDVYQLNTTYYDALGRSDNDYLIARAIQFFAPGVPQVYYVGFLGGTNDLDLLAKTGVGRDINRRFYQADDLQNALSSPLVKSLSALIRLRNTAAAFNGDFTLRPSASDHLILRWQDDDSYIELTVNLSAMSATIHHCQEGMASQYTIDHTLRAAS